MFYIYIHVVDAFARWIYGYKIHIYKSFHAHTLWVTTYDAVFFYKNKSSWLTLI
jgi:hypothetical protein